MTRVDVFKNIQKKKKKKKNKGVRICQKVQGSKGTSRINISAHISFTIDHLCFSSSHSHSHSRSVLLFFPLNLHNTHHSHHPTFLWLTTQQVSLDEKISILNNEKSIQAKYKTTLKERIRVKEVHY